LFGFQKKSDISSLSARDMKRQLEAPDSRLFMEALLNEVEENQKL
jgi:hypothetical protein